MYLKLPSQEGVGVKRGRFSFWLAFVAASLATAFLLALTL